MSMIQIPVALRGTAPAPFVAEDGGGLVRTSECQAVSPFLATAIGYSREAKPLEPPLVPLMRGGLNPGPDQPLEGDEQRAAADQDDAEAIRRRETLAQRQQRE
jgi:hypothetical protein